MQQNQPIHQIIAEAVKGLPADMQREVAHFVDFLRHRYEESEASLAEDYMRLSADSLKKIWDNDEDAIYDKL